MTDLVFPMVVVVELDTGDLVVVDVTTGMVLPVVVLPGDDVDVVDDVVVLTFDWPLVDR